MLGANPSSYGLFEDDPGGSTAEQILGYSDYTPARDIYTVTDGGHPYPADELLAGGEEDRPYWQMI